ncbi:MAG: DUF3943 domain-containing protein [Acidobacteria bacterium]|nr:DUF3943 domain-containing protein [Acidobacteriota bacterium]
MRILAVVLMVTGVLGSAGTAEAQTTSLVPPETTPIVADTIAPPPVPPAEKTVRKSFLVPALEIVGFDALLNRFNYYTTDKVVYGISVASIRRNATHKWIVDTDPFAMNQFYHPYQGSLYFGFARSAGLNYWTALGYTFAGSMLWEIAGETGPPSYNDQITTGFGGTFLGESLFRTASLLLERGNGNVGFWRGLGAALISPATGFNRLAGGERFDEVLPSRDPALFARLRLGASLSEKVSQEGVSQTFKRKEAIADFQMSYGLPGKPGYRYTRPFDYFDFQFTAVNTSAFENIMSRGLLAGTDYAVGDAYRGVWGLYGSYDYITPQIFRVSSTALGLGTTGAWRIARSVQFQGTLLGSLGYGAAGVSHSSSAERDYHYGATPQGLLALRLLFGGIANLDMTVRGYYVSGTASTENRGSEQIARGDAALTVRVYHHSTVTLKYVASRRDAYYPNLPDRHQTIGAFSLLYGYISSGHKFGAVEWLPKDAPVR